MELPYNNQAMAAWGDTYALLASVAPSEVDLDGIHRFVDDLELALGRLHDQLAAAYFPEQDLEATSS